MKYENRADSRIEAKTQTLRLGVGEMRPSSCSRVKYESIYSWLWDSMRGEYWWKVRRVSDKMEFEDRHARSSYVSLKIVYVTFKLDERVGKGVVVQH